MWRRLLPDTAAHARYLGISDGGPALAALAQAWSSLPSSSHWMFWTARGKRRASSSGRSYKLYVSPKPESLSGDGFAQIVSALTAARATSFKTGAGVTGMLRPDKIVGYFADFESLGEGASRIGERLDGMPAHGVPFTAEIGGDGLVSWGVTRRVATLPGAEPRAGACGSRSVSRKRSSRPAARPSRGGLQSSVFASKVSIRKAGPQARESSRRPSAVSFAESFICRRI